MREVEVRAVLVDYPESFFPEVLVSWVAPDGRVVGAKVPVTNGLPLPSAPRKPEIWERDDLTEADRRWFRKWSKVT